MQKMYIETKIQKNKGAAMMTVVLFFMFISLTILIGIVTPTVREYRIVSDNLDSKKSFFIADSGVEDVIYRIKNNMEIGSINSDRTLFLDNHEYPLPTEISDIGNNQKQITVTGDINTNQRKIDLSLTASSGVSFNYGILVGQGGINLTGSGTVIGNIYANGPITGDSSAIITGSAISANSPDLASDQSNGTGSPSGSIDFGGTKPATSQDLAQGFRVSGAITLNKISLYIKKTGAPSSATVRIVNDSNGSPSSLSPIAMGTLLATSVTTTYGWIDVSFSTNPLLDPSKNYWIVIDCPQSSGGLKYFTIGATLGDNYSNGVTKLGVWQGTWNNTNPSGLDVYFNLYGGGINGLIAGNSGSVWNPLHIGTISGSAQAHTINYTNVTGDIYCKSGTGNNKSCIDQPDPSYIGFPVSDANIAQWKAEAEAGGVINGDYGVGWQGTTLGPKKINGTLTISSGGTLTLTGNLWVTGFIYLTGGSTIKLASNYGINDGVIIAGDLISISGGARAIGSGIEGSYLMLISLKDSLSALAIDISGGSDGSILYAPYGTIRARGGSYLKEATAYKINIEGNSSIEYESGLVNNSFSSGPSGSWGIDNWKEL